MKIDNDKEFAQVRADRGHFNSDRDDMYDILEIDSDIFDFLGEAGITFVSPENYIEMDQAGAVFDLLMSEAFQSKCHKLIIKKSLLKEDFFDLSTGLLGELFQKCVNYHIKLAIIGDFNDNSRYMKDFILECNQGKQFIFASTVKEAIEKFTEIKD